MSKSDENSHRPLRITVPHGLTPNYTSDLELKNLSLPGVIHRLRQLPRQHQDYIKKDLTAFLRAERGERERPDLDPQRQVTQAERDANPAWKLGLPSPFAPPEKHRADRDPERAIDRSNPQAAKLASETRQYLRDLTGQIQAEVVTEKLCERMGTDADRPLEPPTLRDQLAAAAAVIDPSLTGGN